MPKPLLVPHDGELLPRTLPVPAPPEPPARAAADDEAAPGPRSVLIAWARERLMQGAPGAYQALARIGLWPAIAPVPPFPELGTFRRPPSPEMKAAWEATARILAALKAETERHGARLLLAYVPSRMEVRDADWELTRRRHGLGTGKWDQAAAAGRLEEIARSAGIPWIDLTPALRREERGILGGPYYREDLHWNATGHRAAASEVMAFLQSQRWLPRCGTSTTSTRATPGTPGPAAATAPTGSIPKAGGARGNRP
jgi:hypothetical protein